MAMEDSWSEYSGVHVLCQRDGAMIMLCDMCGRILWYSHKEDLLLCILCRYVVPLTAYESAKRN